jgi:hypothetical protein
MGGRIMSTLSDVVVVLDQLQQQLLEVRAVVELAADGIESAIDGDVGCLEKFPLALRGAARALEDADRKVERAIVPLQLSETAGGGS